MSEEVEYLGYLSPNGLFPTNWHLLAVKNLPVPGGAKEVRQFIGLTSYYCWFVPGFSKIAEPIYALTNKNAIFEWTSECQSAFMMLKSKPMEAPVLSFPNFSKSFVLEADASIKGLGGVLSQKQEDGRLYPIAYASRSLSQSEKRYAITELETLAVVWALSYFHAYLYGNDITVYTDHSAVKAVLATPSANGKHARCWSKVYGTGVKNVNIIYRSGKENANADALSWNPVSPPPAQSQETVQTLAWPISSGPNGQPRCDCQQDLFRTRRNHTSSSNAYEEVSSSISPWILLVWIQEKWAWSTT